MSKFNNSIRIAAIFTASAIATVTFVACAADTRPIAESVAGAAGGDLDGVSEGSSVSDNGWGGLSMVAAGAGGSLLAAAGAAGSARATAGAGGSSRTHAAAGAGGAAGAPPLDTEGSCLKTTVCGDNPCSTENITGGISFTTPAICACCAANNACGMYAVSADEETRCIELNEDGQETPDCPTMFEEAGLGNIDPQSVPGFSSPDYTLTADIRGCCRPDGRCGWVMPTLGVGCIALDEIHSVSSLFDLIVLPPVYCEYDWGKPR
jgi:hypothetical protein